MGYYLQRIIYININSKRKIFKNDYKYLIKYVKQKGLYIILIIEVLGPIPTSQYIYL